MNKSDIKNRLDNSNERLSMRVEDELVKLENLIKAVRLCQKHGGPTSFPIDLHHMATHSKNIEILANRIAAQEQVSSMISLNSDRRFQAW